MMWVLLLYLGRQNKPVFFMEGVNAVNDPPQLYVSYVLFDVWTLNKTL